jgi:divalent metal cation (Fe/Co/Zn/Cd) transporter
MRIKYSDSPTAMGIALTLLVAGIIVQLTAGLQLFGQKSVVPLILGGIVIIIGLVVVYVMRRMEVARKGSKDKNRS